MASLWNAAAAAIAAADDPEKFARFAHRLRAGRKALTRFAFEHFAERIHLVPAYRRRLAQVPLNIAHPTWVDDPDFDLACHVCQHQLPPGTSLQGGIDTAVALAQKARFPVRATMSSAGILYRLAGKMWATRHGSPDAP